MQCNAMQCNAMQCNAMQCNAMQCNAMQCNAMQCNAMQCNAMDVCMYVCMYVCVYIYMLFFVADISRFILNSWSTHTKSNHIFWKRCEWVGRCLRVGPVVPVVPVAVSRFVCQTELLPHVASWLDFWLKLTEKWLRLAEAWIS